MIPHNINPDDDISPGLLFAIIIASIAFFPMLMIITDFIAHALALPPDSEQALSLIVIITAMTVVPLLVAGLIAHSQKGPRDE